MGTALLTLAVGAAAGLLFYRLKIPGGLIVGAIIGTAVLGVGFEAASIPGFAKTIAQITAGSFIGCTVGKEDLRRLPRILKPLLILAAGYVALNVTVGFLFYAITDLDMVTSFMSAVPGGMTDIPIIAADMGASVPKVAVLQFVRMSAGLGLFPMMITRAAHLTPVSAPVPAGAVQVPEPESAPAAPAPASKPRDPAKGPAVVLLTVAVGAAFGLLGKAAGIPAGTILFSTVSVLVFKLVFGRAYIPRWLKRVAQILTGCYIGCCFGRQELLDLKYLLLPALLLLAGYFGHCFLMGWLLPRFTHLSKAEAMLVATPAGASDMALISSDMGVDSPDVAFIQILRMIIVVTVFPHIIRLVIFLAGG